ncbi:triggering receptor expressed on myeloid cells 2-like isoform X1 [Neopsephotus bourkii]|uniref:triggering receptor expressed on myeloid cells 2-like isoform X1 n=1 Tax=Neopsephotus bourkii TaxID=309878 RepID=UPI002AA5CB52|nr:triggering receptor expressed on myeloid cells 2-like isoform X1 [Neopsephotus bourkii]
MPSSCAHSFRQSKEGAKQAALGQEPFSLFSRLLSCLLCTADMEKLVHLIFLVFLPGACAAENITVVYGMEGDTISVNCTYNPWQQRWREKSWCKQIHETKCQHVVSARRFWLPFLKNRNGTTSISDNVREGVLTVTIKGLKKQDAGLYQCKSDYLGETNSLRKVQVEVLTAVLETQMPEEPRAVHSISSIPPEADFTVLYILAGLLVSKFLVAVLIFIIGNSRKSRGREWTNPRLSEQQVLPFAGDGISPSWESTA